MMQLKNIELSDEEVAYYIDNYFDYGSESTIYKASNHQAYKIWRDDSALSKEKVRARNERKMQKIIRYHRKQIDYITQPLATLSNHGNCIGFAMDYSPDDDILLISPIERDERLEILRSLPEILDYFYNEGIIYGDIKNDNILVNRKTKSITFCDIDNSKVEDLPMDIQPEELESFIANYGQEDDKIHAYMHNLLTLEQLDDEVCMYEEVIEKISQNEYHGLVAEPGKVLLKEMKKITPQYSGEYIVNYIKK